MDDDDPLCQIAHRIHQLAKAVTPPATAPGTDAAGVSVECLTEAVTGVTAGLCRVADALQSIADAIRETRNP